MLSERDSRSPRLGKRQPLFAGSTGWAHALGARLSRDVPSSPCLSENHRRSEPHAVGLDRVFRAEIILKRFGVGNARCSTESTPRALSPDRQQDLASSSQSTASGSGLSAPLFY